jgi:hypothetical protein
MKRIAKLTRNSEARFVSVIFLALGIGLGLYPLNAHAQSPGVQGTIEQHPPAVIGASTVNAVVSQPTQAVSKPYYIEFRARNAESYGHTFSIYGRLNAQGKIASKTVAGLHPATESPLPWMIGHLVLVPSETGASDGDTEDQYVLARFQVALSAEEYKKVTTYIKDLQKKSPVWHAVLYNCNAFVGDIAHFMGMETPQSTMMMPANYINGLRDLNISKAGKAGVIGTPVKVGDAEHLRADALKALEQQERRKAATGSRRGPSDQNQPVRRGAAPATANTSPAADRPKTLPRGPV